MFTSFGVMEQQLIQRMDLLAFETTKRVYLGEIERVWLIRGRLHYAPPFADSRLRMQPRSDAWARVIIL